MKKMVQIKHKFAQTQDKVNKGHSIDHNTDTFEDNGSAIKFSECMNEWNCDL